MKTHDNHRPSSSWLAILVAAFLVIGPAAKLRAQDDDMPDGDVDLVEKPKKKAPKKEEKKKEEKKKEAKKEEPKKKDEPKARPEPKNDPDSVVEDDILAPAHDPKEKAPPKQEEPKKAPPPAEDDEEEGGGKSRLLHSIDSPVAPVVDDEPKAPPPPAKPAKGERDAAADARRAAAPHDKPVHVSADAPAIDDDDDLPLAPIKSERPRRAFDAEDAAPRARSDDDPDGSVRTVDTDRALVPEESDSDGMPWIIAGATGGGLVLLAAAGVGGYFLVDALTPKNGTIIVTAH